METERYINRQKKKMTERKEMRGTARAHRWTGRDQDGTGKRDTLVKENFVADCFSFTRR